MKRDLAAIHEVLPRVTYIVTVISMEGCGLIPLFPMAWRNGVVPTGANLMVLDMQFCHCRRRYFHAPRVRPLPPLGRDPQSRFTLGSTQEPQQHFRRLQRHASPVGADRSEQAVLHRIPLR